MYLNQRTTLRPLPQDRDPDPTRVLPSGYYGAGVWTAHPIGRFIVSSMMVVGLLGLPEARLFFAGVFPLSALCGFLLWRSHDRVAVDLKVVPANCNNSEFAFVTFDALLTPQTDAPAHFCAMAVFPARFGPFRASQIPRYN
jgi:hypothetical protein